MRVRVNLYSGFGVAHPYGYAHLTAVYRRPAYNRSLRSHTYAAELVLIAFGVIVVGGFDCDCKGTAVVVAERQGL